jgi:hypothetical protein
MNDLRILTWCWRHLLAVCRAVSRLACCRASWSWGCKFPNAKVKSYTEMGNKIKIGPAPEIPPPFLSNFQQVRESGDTDFCPPVHSAAITARGHQQQPLPGPSQFLSSTPYHINQPLQLILLLASPLCAVSSSACMHIEIRNKQA